MIAARRLAAVFFCFVASLSNGLMAPLSARNIGSVPSRLSFSSADLTGDGGVVKVSSTSSDGMKQGLFDEDGAVAQLRYKAYGGESGVLLAQGDLAYTVGDVSFIAGMDAAVRSMAVGESASFECGAAYAYGDAGLPPAVSPGEFISLQVDVLDYRGKVMSTSFAQDKPLTPRTASEIKSEYERRRADRLKAEVAEVEDDSLLAPLKSLVNTIRGYYFFGFFESATGETPPWYLRPLITFPSIFVVVGVSTYFLLTNDVILLKGQGSTIPGETPFSL